ncbi:DEAD/DEAH box helicase [Acidobacteria bacterium AH-259-D05]|nr:DEAD/DEAH box helicase [Acidobacteria bacterium AH-259-D05]
MNLIDLAAEIERRYRQYLETTFYLKDPDLRRSFQKALASGHLSRGPFVESTPVFKRGQSSSQLFRALLSSDPDAGFLQSTERHLYLHQEEAIRKVFAEERNVVVATGTASGKTETFLYPILLHLYEQFTRDELGPGVRALILYPMNALANDQRERLGSICEKLESLGSPFKFTFGQYIGETPEDDRDIRRHAQERLSQRLPGELILRKEIRAAPPHILLTNYSMLEYLLIRPADSPLFDQGCAVDWKFIVLDEAHQYRGSKGMEMSMLVRRLKQRLWEGGCRNDLRCIATSATLGGGQEDRPEVAQFGYQLFGEPFEADAIVLGETEPIEKPSSLRQLPVEHYSRLSQFCEEEGYSVDRLCKDLGLDSRIANEDPAAIVGEILTNDERSDMLRRRISASPQLFSELARELFPELDEGEAADALSGLIQLLLTSRDPHTGQPLLAARYHFFLRSLEGAFLSYLPQPRLALERLSDSDGGAFFEVALCRECGQHYLVGREVAGKLAEAVRDPSDPNFGATFFRPVEEEDEEGEGEDGSTGGDRQILKLCTRCGTLSRRAGACDHSELISVAKQEEAWEKEDQVPRCSSCGYRAQDPVREVVHGTDGPHVVIATTLFRKMPTNRKKVLAFADSRQEAAFFAWYLENSYKDILARNLILQALQALAQHSAEGLSLRELVPALRDVYRKHGVFPESAGDLEILREAWVRLFREFLTEEQRISLEGVGLVTFRAKLPETLKVPDVIMREPWELSEAEARDLIGVLLDFMRLDKAVDLRTGPEVADLTWGDLGLQGRGTGVSVGRPGGRKKIKSWDGPAGRRALYLTKFLMRDNSIARHQASAEAQDLLRAVWECLKATDEAIGLPQDRVLISDRDSRLLNPDWWRVTPLDENNVIHQCDICARLYSVSIRGVCPRTGCPGTLQATTLQQLEPNHYRALYREDLDGLLRVEEHTAQLDPEKARDFQRSFKRGEIHVLSCSTTFEVGVDLGDLDVIFLRNVPPEAFNYAQRVGRAGRREQYPGFALTFCRQRPHDLYYFQYPERIIAGVIRAPVLSLTNKKIILRHVVATVLSKFFRENELRFEKVAGLFGDLENPTLANLLHEFLKENQDALVRSLKAIVPAESHERLGLLNGSWISEIAGAEGRIAMVQAELSSDYKTVVELEKKSASEGDYKTAKWANARARTIYNENVLSFLSRKAIIPKYGFPVDVVELDLQRTRQSPSASEVSLQRDLSIAISEFAPTSRLVANKKEWSSYGLKKVLERQWEEHEYRRCPHHSLFQSWSPGEEPPAFTCCTSVVEGRFLIPQFGFISDGQKPSEPTGRPFRVFSTRPYFIGLAGSEPSEMDFGPLQLTKASPGTMAILCEGRRGRCFYVCMSCGAGFRDRLPKHKNPFGRECSGSLQLTALGHVFVTDVVKLVFERKPPNQDLDPNWFAYSLAYAVLEGSSSILEVPDSDLNVTVTFLRESPIPPIVLYDNVPGGAGLVARLQEKETLEACLNAALERVSGACGCGENDSCYGCLRTYRNQFAHSELRRGPVMKYLKSSILGKLYAEPIVSQEDDVDR